MSKYIAEVTSIYFVDDLGNKKFILKCTALPNAYTICEILNADLIKNGKYSIWKYKELVEKEQKIEDLEEKLAKGVEIINGWIQLNIEKSSEINQLEQQLAEKEKEIEKLTEELDDKNFCKDFVDLYTENKLKTQMLHENWKDKISFAVDILEELTDCSNYIDSKLDFESGSYVSEKAIRYKIEYLKGKKDE